MPSIILPVLSMNLPDKAPSIEEVPPIIFPIEPVRILLISPLIVLLLIGITLSLPSYLLSVDISEIISGELDVILSVGLSKNPRITTIVPSGFVDPVAISSICPGVIGVIISTRLLVVTV